MPYKHFGARLARLDRFDSCTLHHLLEGCATFHCGSLANCSCDQHSRWLTQVLWDSQIWLCTRLLSRAGLAACEPPGEILSGVRCGGRSRRT